MRTMLIGLLLVAGFVAGFLAAAMRPVPPQRPVDSHIAPEPIEAPTPVPEGQAGTTSDKGPDESAAAKELGYTLGPAVHDYGKLWEGEVRAHTVKLEHPLTKEPIQLGRLYSPCPCVFVRSAARTYDSVTPISVEVSVHTLGLAGKQSFPFYVEVAKPIGKIIRGEVRLEALRVPAKVFVEPRRFHLGSVTGTKEFSARLYNLTEQPLVVKTVACSLADVKVSIPEGLRIEAGAYATVNLQTPLVGMPVGAIEGEVVLETDVPEHARMAIPVDGTVLKPRK